MAICGAWGQGKSSFMKLMETEMLLQAQPSGLWPSGSSWSPTPSDKLTMRRVASPQLMCAWFNAWYVWPCRQSPPPPPPLHSV